MPWIKLSVTSNASECIALISIDLFLGPRLLFKKWIIPSLRSSLGLHLPLKQFLAILFFKELFVHVFFSQSSSVLIQGLIGNFSYFDARITKGKCQEQGLPVEMKKSVSQAAHTWVTSVVKSDWGPQGGRQGPPHFDIQGGRLTKLNRVGDQAP